MTEVAKAQPLVVDEGVFPGGLPYLAIGTGRPVVYLVGLGFENANPRGWARDAAIRSVRPLALAGYTIYMTTRRPRMARGVTMAAIAAELAGALDQYFVRPVDVIGHSTGGSLALALAVDHSSLIRRLVIASAAYEMGPLERRLQAAWVQGLVAGRNFNHVLAPGLTPNRAMLPLVAAGLWLSGLVIRPPRDLTDMIVMSEAEENFNVRDRLGSVNVPTLVIGGERDTFYSPELFRETAERIPNARLLIYRGKGHAIQVSARFYDDVLKFLAA